MRGGLGGVTLGWAAMGFLLIFEGGAAAQETYLDPNAQGCSVATNLTEGPNSYEKRKIEIPRNGTVASISSADDGFDDPLSAQITAFCKQEGNKVTISAKGRMRNDSSGPPGQQNTRASVSFYVNMQPYARPSNTDYVVTAEGGFTVTWNRGGANNPGYASASISMGPCNNSIGASAGPEATGSTPPQSEIVRCKVRSGDPSGYLGTLIPVNMAGQVDLKAGTPQDFAFDGNVVFTLARVGKALELVGGPTEGVEDANPSFPQPFVVKVLQNDTGAAVAGEPVAFQLRDPAGNPVGAVPTATAETLADGAASVNFKVADPGDYRVEAVCAGCVEGSPAVFTVNVKAIETHLEKVPGAESGDKQPGMVGKKFEIPLRVRVLRTNGVLLPDVAVSFSQVSGPGPLGFTTPNAVTDSSGVATTEIIAGPAGDYIIEAFCPSCTGPAAGFGVAAAGSSGGSGTDHRRVTLSAKVPNAGLKARAKVRPPQVATRSTCGATLQMRHPFRNGERVTFADGDTIPWCTGVVLDLVPVSDQADSADVIQIEGWQFQQSNPPSPELFKNWDPFDVEPDATPTDFLITPKNPGLFAGNVRVRWDGRSCFSSPRRVMAWNLALGELAVSPPSAQENLLPGKHFSLRIPVPGADTTLLDPHEMRRFISVDIVDVVCRGSICPRPSIWVFEVDGSEEWIGQSLKLDFKTLEDRTAAPLRVEISVLSICGNNSIQPILLKPGSF